MKKGIIVLLITVLAAGLVFADFSGSASIDFGASLDKKGWGFTNKNGISQYSFEFSFDTQSGSKGEDHQSSIWAEIAGEAYASYVVDVKNGYKELTPDLDWGITVANIHVYDFTIGILGPKSAYNYAKSWTNDGYPNYTANHDFANNAKGAFEYTAGGFNVSYQGYTVSVALNNAYTAGSAASEDKDVEPKWFKDDEAAEAAGYDPSKKITPASGSYGAWYYVVKGDEGSSASSKLTAFANVETKAYELAEGMTLQAAGNLLLVGKDSKPVVGGAVKYAYEADKLSLGLATDVQFDANSKVISLDALATAKYDFINGAVYFGSDELGKDGAAYILEAKVGAAIPVADDVKINVSAEVDDLDFAKKENAFKLATYSVSAGTTVDKLTANASFKYNTLVDKIDSGSTKLYGMIISADVTYAAEIFTAKAGLSVGMLGDKEVAIYNIKPSVSISSNAVVEGATLSLGWSGANLVTKDFEDADTYTKGSINATAKISF